MKDRVEDLPIMANPNLKLAIHPSHQLRRRMMIRFDLMEAEELFGPRECRVRDRWTKIRLRTNLEKQIADFLCQDVIKIIK